MTTTLRGVFAWRASSASRWRRSPWRNTSSAASPAPEGAAAAVRREARAVDDGRVVELVAEDDDLGALPPLPLLLPLLLLLLLLLARLLPPPPAPAPASTVSTATFAAKPARARQGRA